MTSFEITGPVAFFRRPGMTTSQTSLPFPPPPTILGLVSAILGIDRGDRDTACADYWDHAHGTAVGVEILSPGRNVVTGNVARRLNKIKTTAPGHIVSRQVLVEPRYRIYVEGPLEEGLYMAIKECEYVFPPALGVSWAPAEILAPRRERASRLSVSTGRKDLLVHSVLPSDIGECLVNFADTVGDVFRERVVAKMDRDRNPRLVLDAYYNLGGTPIAVTVPARPEREDVLFYETGLHSGCVALFPRF